eukprot:evm.model.scf_853EXC.6 EVM.evm.TU.scf_853EXC.6   scf_853EXC:58036-60614(-)
MGNIFQPPSRPTGPTTSTTRPTTNGTTTTNGGTTAPTSNLPVPDRVVTRQEIRKMSSGDQQRFVAAVKRMMVNRNGVPETSEFFRLAGYHGWPGRAAMRTMGLPFNPNRDAYCAHRAEHFPAWHRAYLTEFERALQAADRDLGGDGNVALPYWDWTDVDGGEVFPRVIRENFGEPPEGLLAPRRASSGVPAVRQFYEQGYAAINGRSDAEIAGRLRSARVFSEVNRALEQEEHYRFANQSEGGNNSIEAPHGDVHVAVGFPMSSLMVAAFHPIFWLHHCNVDRFLSKYLELEPDSQDEFRQHQLLELETNPRHTVDFYTTPLEPFAHPNGQRWMAADTFDTEALGYRYDSLPPTPAQQMRQVPTRVKFTVDVLKIGQHSYTLYVFVVKKEDADAWQAPELKAKWLEDPAFAGITTVFGGRGSECAGCRRNPVFSVFCDITSALQHLGLTRHEVAVKVLCADELDNVVSLDAAKIPPPEVVGAFFEEGESLLQKGIGLAIKVVGEVLQVQRFLSRYGWLKGVVDVVVDGVFGDKTEAAVKKFQKFVGLVEDGVVGPATKQKIVQRRMDDVEDQVDDDDRANYKRGSTVKYWVGTQPGYLDRLAVMAEIRRGFRAWEDETGVCFREAPTKAAAKVTVTWGNRSPDNLFEFDGPGGALAHSTKNYIQFDSSERWLCQGQPAKPGRFYLYPVALHEMGHVLGLTHSTDPNDVMSPYYVPDRVELQPGDKQRAAALT